LRKPRELTKPVRRKKNERLARPEKMRRTIGSCRKIGGVSSVMEAARSMGLKEGKRWLVTMVAALMPLSPYYALATLNDTLRQRRIPQPI
jgi:hypothetical protein